MGDGDGSQRAADIKRRVTASHDSWKLGKRGGAAVRDLSDGEVQIENIEDI